MMIKILMHGCNGRMGQMISGLVRDEEEMMIAAGVDTYQGVSNEYPVFGSIDACDDDVDVVIDFSGVVFGLLAALFLLLLVRMFHVLRESKTPL